MNLSSALQWWHKIVTNVVFLFLIICIGVWVKVSSITGRPAYSARRIQEHELFRDVLVNRFGAKPVSFNTADGIKLSALLLIRPHAKKNVVACHGYRMSKERMHRCVLIFPDDNILLFDYRAHGQSEGANTTIGYKEKEDVIAALTFMHENADTKDLPIVGLGVSMGAVSLLAAASQTTLCKAIVLDSPFSRLDEQTYHEVTQRNKLPRIPFAYLVHTFFEYMHSFQLKKVSSRSCAKKVHIPTFLIHTKQDKTVPIASAYSIYDRLQGPKDLWVISGSEHAHLFTDLFAEYCKRTRSFFDAALN